MMLTMFAPSLTGFLYLYHSTECFDALRQCRAAWITLNSVQENMLHSMGLL